MRLYCLGLPRSAIRKAGLKIVTGDGYLAQQARQLLQTLAILVRGVDGIGIDLGDGALDLGDLRPKSWGQRGSGFRPRTLRRRRLLLGEGAGERQGEGYSQAGQPSDGTSYPHLASP